MYLLPDEDIVILVDWGDLLDNAGRAQGVQQLELHAT